MFQTKQMLEKEIQKYQPLKHKVQHQSMVKKDLLKNYNQLANIYVNEQETKIYDSIAIEAENDGLQAEKFALVRLLRQDNQNLQVLLLQKSCLLKNCEINEDKIRSQKQKLRTFNRQIRERQTQKINMVKLMQENQIQNMKVRLQNEKIRKDCEEYIERITNITMQNDKSQIQQLIMKQLTKNIEIAKKIQFLSQKLKFLLIQEGQFLKDKQQLQILHLTSELKIQNDLNNQLRVKLNNEQCKQWTMSMKQQVLIKTTSCKIQFKSNISSEQQNIISNIAKGQQQNVNLRLKLQKFIAIQREMIEVHQNLTSNYGQCKKNDRSGILQMNKNSSRVQKTMDHQRHFLKERFTIVDQYRKYLFKQQL